jgi:endogenous inhibitor of DNA gyrase (YacG/DUF329 family)
MQAKSPEKGGPSQGPPKESQGPTREPQGPADGSGGAAAKGKRSAKKCPICGKPATETSRPFCSERCRDVDLNRWLSNSYAIPGRPEADEDED